MSLNRQLWLAVVVMMVLAFGGTFVISTAAARHYFADQLLVKNIDNATALALSMSQMEKDPITLELLLSAQFDAGHYRLIRLTDPKGKTMVERRDDAPIEGVPVWFLKLVALDIPPGRAQVQDGWKQYGTLTLESHDQYAYTELWRGMWRLLGWFTLTAAVVGAVASALLRLILRPLKAVVVQAEAIGARQFITQPEPNTTEFRQVVGSMNKLSARVQQMLEDEARRVEQLRMQAQIDPVTGLRNRETFIASLEDALVRDDFGASGVLVIVRIAGLAELNRRLGRVDVDQLLRRMGDHLAQAATGHRAPWIVARLGAADFAVMAPGETDALSAAQILYSQTQLAIENPLAGEAAGGIWIGCTPYQRGELRAAVLARADGALAHAEQSGTRVVPAPDPGAQSHLPTDMPSWRRALEDAMRKDGVQLGRFPVVTAAGVVLHHEAPVRLKLGKEWLPAASFIAWAARLDLMPRLDLMVIEAALTHIEKTRQPLSVNIAPETLCDPQVAGHLDARTRDTPELAGLLWLEVSEYGALRHLPEFRRFCITLKPLGCKLGLKHAGQQFSRISELHDLGLDYLKIDGSIVQRARDGADHQAFLRSLCTIAHTIGLTTIAAGVHRDEDLQMLSGLGIDGFTGPAVQVSAIEPDR